MFVLLWIPLSRIEPISLPILKRDTSAAELGHAEFGEFVGRHIVEYRIQNLADLDD